MCLAGLAQNELKAPSTPVGAAAARTQFARKRPGAPHQALFSSRCSILLPFPTSAYTEPFPINTASAGQSAEEDHGRTSEEEEGVGEPSFDRQVRQMEEWWRRRKGGKVNMMSE